VYPDSVENLGTLPVLRCNTAREGVNHYEHNTLNLPVSVRTGTCPRYVDTGWAFFIFTLIIVNVEKLGGFIMSKKVMPVQADQGKIIQFSDYKDRVFKKSKYSKKDLKDAMDLLVQLESLSISNYHKMIGKIKGRVKSLEQEVCDNG
jgi:hypothetical protein